MTFLEGFESWMETFGEAGRKQDMAESRAGGREGNEHLERLLEEYKPVEGKAT